MAEAIASLLINVQADVARLSKDVNAMKSQFSSLRTSVSSIDTATKSLSDGFKNLVTAGLAIVSVTQVYHALKDVITDAIASASAQEDAEVKLAQAIGGTSQMLLDQASALQSTTKFSDDQIISAQALIGAFTNDEAQIKRLTQSTLDLASAKGMDLSSAADLVAKSFGTSTNALTRYGVEAEGAARSTDRLIGLTSGIERLYGGQAAANASTFAGSIAQITNAHDDLLEEIGNIIVKNEFFISVLNDVKTALIDAAEWVKTNRKELMALAKDGFVSIVEGAAFVASALRELIIVWDLLKLGANVALTAIVTAIDLLVKSIAFLTESLDKVMQFLFGIQTGAADTIKSITDFSSRLRETFAETNIEILKDMASVSDRFKSVIDALHGWADSLESTSTGETTFKSTAKNLSNVSEEMLISKKEAEALANVLKDLESEISRMNLEVIKLTESEDTYINAMLATKINIDDNIELVDRYKEAMNALALAKLSVNSIQLESGATIADTVNVPVALTGPEAEEAQFLASVLIDLTNIRDNNNESMTQESEIALSLVGAYGSVAAQYAAQITAQERLNSITNAGKSALQSYILGTKSFSEALKEQLANTLASWAAQDAIAAIRELAYGFATMFTNPAESASHFQAAALFGSVAVAEGAVANSLVGSEETSAAATESTTSSTGTSDDSVTDGDVNPTQEITINVYNPLDGDISDDVADSIIEAINAAGDRNVRINAQSMGVL